MSMSSWTENGYGYELFNGNNFGKVKEFILQEFKSQRDNAKQEDQFSYNEKIDLLEAATEEIELEEICKEAVSHFIAGCINSRENISMCSGFCACGETDEYERIGLTPTYPWYYDNEDKNMTEEKAKEIMKKYAEILGITEEPEYFSQEYYG